MLGNLIALFILAINFAVISGAENTTSECMTQGKIFPERCCLALPTFVTGDLVMECGLKGDGFATPTEKAPCEPFTCILAKYNLTLTNNKINQTAIKDFLAQQYDTTWKTAIDMTLKKCFGELTATEECETSKFSNCFRISMALNCSEHAWIQSDNCANTKNLMKKCFTKL